jgi:microsomal dipeptidase-like Zn-dependent dipeptidase
MRRHVRRPLLLFLFALMAVVLWPAAPTVRAQTAVEPIWGFADLHNHMFANLGFGGLAIWGNPFVEDDDIAKALPWSDFLVTGPAGGVVVEPQGGYAPVEPFIGLFPFPNIPASCPPGSGLFNPCFGVQVHGAGGFRDLLNMFLSGRFGHAVGGYPQFDGWPRWDNFTGQQMYYSWLKRAHDGGMRLTVMMAVNNEALCRATRRLNNYSCEDMPAIERQIQATKNLERFVDRLSGGPGQGWFRIAYSAAQAREIIAAGKLAVVLGIETPSLFGCKVQAHCTPEYVEQELQRFYDMGVRHIFPMHNSDSGFGGTAFFNEVLAFSERIINDQWWDVRSCPAESGVDLHLGLLDTINDLAGFPILGDWLALFTHGLQDLPPRPPAGSNCNNKGLTAVGAALVNGMMDRGMLIDIDHMSQLAFDDTLDLAEARSYPGVISSHTGFVEMGQTGHGKRHEGNKTAAQLERLRAAGGMVSTILNQGSRAEIKQYVRPDGSVPVPFDCGKSSKAWAQAYLYAVEKMGGAPVAVGSDFNGLSGLPAPRFHFFEACGGDHDPFYDPGARVEYPFTPHGIAGSLNRMQVGQRTFDYNEDGLANVGMFPDFIEDLKKVGLTNADLAPLFGSAEAYIRIWERADDRTGPEIVCASADGLWHGENVMLECSSSDAVSGLADPADAVFALATTVAGGEETSHALTGTRTVCDARGNCSAAGPIVGNRIDSKAPVVAVTSPAPVAYARSASLTLDYTATDGGSGVSSTIATLNGSGTIAGHGLNSGQAIDLLAVPLGAHNFVVQAGDAVGHVATKSVIFDVVATTASIKDTVRRFHQTGDIPSATTVRLLITALEAAERMRAAGRCDTAGQLYQAFGYLVRLLTPKAISLAASAILIGDAAYLGAHCS